MVFYSLFYLHIRYCISAKGAAAECYLKQFVSMQKRIVRYVCHVPALSPTNPLFVKTGLLKLNDVLKLQVCKFIQNSITGFDVEHKSFTLTSSLHLHYTRFSKKLNFITERHRTRLGLNFFRYFGPRFWSSVPESLKKIKKDEFRWDYKKIINSKKSKTGLL